MIYLNEDIQSNKISSAIHEADITDNWSVNGNPNGGYLLALIVKALLDHTENIKTPIITANYISKCVPGKAEIQIEEISLTKQFHRFEAKLFQKKKEKIRVLATFTLENDQRGITRYEKKSPPLAQRNFCVPVPALPKYTLFEQLDILIDPVCAGWMQNQLTDISETKGWIKFKRDQPLDWFSIILVADALPPAVMVSQGMMAWVPTIELSVNIRNLPQSQWLNCYTRTRFITNGILEADGEVWDETGYLIAISRQIAQIKLL